MELIYEDPNVLQSMNVLPSTPKKKPSIPRPRVAKQVKQYSPSMASNAIFGDLNQMDNYLGYQVQATFPTSSYLSPFTETYSEYDVPSPFSGSINSFDVTPSYTPSPSPGFHLELPYHYPIEQSNGFNCYSPIDMTASSSRYAMAGCDMIFTPGYNMYDNQCNDYFMSQKAPQYIDPRLLNA
jgi:hypothetical protein